MTCTVITNATSWLLYVTLAVSLIHGPSGWHGHRYQITEAQLLNLSGVDNNNNNNVLFYVLFQTGAHSPLQSKKQKHSQNAHTHKHACTRAWMHAHKHTRTHKHTHAHTHMHTHTHTHTPWRRDISKILRRNGMFSLRSNGQGILSLAQSGSDLFLWHSRLSSDH